MSAGAEDYAFCEQLLRENDRDRWLACLFAPEEKRPHLHALYAFSHELARIRELVSEPQLGEIRMQWWREILEGQRMIEAAANPVSAALMATVARFNLPYTALVRLVDARRFDLYNAPMPSMNDLEGYCGETVSVLFRLASFILADGRDPGGADASGHAGVAYGIAGLLRALPWHAMRGQCFLPQDLLAEHGALPQAAAAGLTSAPLLSALSAVRAHARTHLDAARAGLSGLEPQARPAFVPLAIVGPVLKRMDRRSYDPFGEIVEVPQWRRQWAMWRWR